MECYMTALTRLAARTKPFTYSQALELGFSDRDLHRLSADGTLARLGRGLYLFESATVGLDLDLLEISLRAPAATLCLTTALARHGLTDEIPPHLDIALSRGTRPPASSLPVDWHSFASKTFEIGRERLKLGVGTNIHIYSAERSIIDAFRMRHQEGSDLAYMALKTWLKRKRSHPSDLLSMARSFPRTLPVLRNAFEILL
jgi:predicted transcriptional regulator of viral defense system